MEKTDEYLHSLPDWQQSNLELFRKLIHEVAPQVTEEIKWSVPVFLIADKMQFAMSAFKAHTKYNFIGNGALIDDPKQLFNNGLESKKSRGIDLRQGETIDEHALKDLIKRSMAYTTN